MVEDKHKGYEEHLRSKGYEGPVSCETPGIPPNAAQQTPEQYIASRFGAIPQEARLAMGLPANPEMYMHLELMFRSCYWRERHDLLESHAQTLIRQTLGGRAAVYSLLKELHPDLPKERLKAKAQEYINNEIEKLPDDFTQMPKL